jgi:hypothetical protein
VIAIPSNRVLRWEPDARLAARRAGYDYAELVRSLALAPAADEELERRAVIRETLRSLAALPAQRHETLLRATADPPGSR